MAAATNADVYTRAQHNAMGQCLAPALGIPTLSDNFGIPTSQGIVYATDLLHPIDQTNQAQLGKIIKGLCRGLTVREISL